MGARGILIIAGTEFSSHQIAFAGSIRLNNCDPVRVVGGKFRLGEFGRIVRNRGFGHFTVSFLDGSEATIDGIFLEKTNGASA